MSILRSFSTKRLTSNGVLQRSYNTIEVILQLLNTLLAGDIMEANKLYNTARFKDDVNDLATTHTLPMECKLNYITMCLTYAKRLEQVKIKLVDVGLDRQSTVSLNN